VLNWGDVSLRILGLLVTTYGIPLDRLKGCALPVPGLVRTAPRYSRGTIPGRQIGEDFLRRRCLKRRGSPSSDHAIGDANPRRKVELRRTQVEGVRRSILAANSLPRGRITREYSL